jgi:hypothetical protein
MHLLYVGESEHAVDTASSKSLGGEPKPAIGGMQPQARLELSS